MFNMYANCSVFNTTVIMLQRSIRLYLFLRNNKNKCTYVCKLQLLVFENIASSYLFVDDRYIGLVG